MKTENTPQEKAKFFAQYYPQKILHHKDYEDFCPVGFGSILSMDYYARNNYYLLLAPLKNISDEDAIEVASILYPHYCGKWKIVDKGGALIKLINDVGSQLIVYKDLSGQYGVNDLDYYLLPRVIDFLRSKSYLIPYKDLSTEDLIAYGWAKEREL